VDASISTTIEVSEKWYTPIKKDKVTSIVENIENVLKGIPTIDHTKDYEALSEKRLMDMSKKERSLVDSESRISLMFEEKELKKERTKENKRKELLEKIEKMKLEGIEKREIERKLNLNRYFTKEEIEKIFT
jgi:hypothetical protein